MTKIADLAASARRRGIAYYGEAAFARLCMDFEKALADQSLNSLLQRLVEFNDAKTMQLGICWLDGQGYGGRPVEWLGYQLAIARKQLE